LCTNVNSFSHLELPSHQLQEGKASILVDCTIIAAKFGYYFTKQKPEVSLLWKLLPQLWICDGNDIHVSNELDGGTAIYLNVEDVVQSVGTDFNVGSESAILVHQLEMKWVA